MKTIFIGFSITNSSVTDYFITVCNKLSKEFRVVVITDKIEKHPFALSSEVKIYKWPTPRPTTVKAFWFLLKKIWQYKPITMISMFGSVNIFTIAGFVMRVKNRIAWIRSLSSQMPESPSQHRRKAYVYKLATHLFANSAATGDDLEVNYGVPRKKVTVVHNAVRKGEAQNSDQDYNTFMFVGNLRPLKGLHVLLDAMPKVLAQFPEAQLKVIGGHIGGKALEEYRAKVAGLMVSDHVRFLGWKQKQEITDALSQVGFSIVPSLIEAFGFVVIESFSVGTPVIGAGTTGIAEIIRDGKDGLLFEPGNANDLADKIIKMLSEKSFRDQCAVNCAQRFLDAFEIEKATDSVVDILQKISR